MFKISKTISQVSSKLALVPFITAGYPNMAITEKVICLLDKQGANIIELGIPYSDALADGIIIQEASRIALQQKTSIKHILDLLHKVTIKIKTPIIIFTYFNPILSRGIDCFVEEIAKAGAQGLVIPDLPLEESDYLIALCSLHNIELIFFISPASSMKRIEKIVSKAPGCLYLVSRYGVTGIKQSLPYNLQSLVRNIRSKTDKSIMLGFGISNVSQVTNITEMFLEIDAIVIGTAFINLITDGYKINNYQDLEYFCIGLKQVLM